MKTEKLIPKGLYCYSTNGYLCPFWKIIDSKPHQLNGYCEYLDVGDWMIEHSSELWDQIKYCDVNEDW